MDTPLIKLRTAYEFDDGKLLQIKFYDVNKEFERQTYLILYGTRHDLNFIKEERNKFYFDGISLDRYGDSSSNWVEESDLDHYVCVDINNMTLTLRENNMIDQWTLYTIE